MSFNTTFDAAGFTGASNDNFGHDGSSTTDGPFDTFNWGNNNTDFNLYTHQYAGSSTNNDGWYLRPSNVAGPSQPYTGLEVLGGLCGFPDINNDPADSHPANQVFLDEGKPP